MKRSVCLVRAFSQLLQFQFFQFAQNAPQFLVIKVPRNLSKFSKSVKLRNTVAFDGS